MDLISLSGNQRLNVQGHAMDYVSTVLSEINFISRFQLYNIVICAFKWELKYPCITIT